MPTVEAFGSREQVVPQNPLTMPEDRFVAWLQTGARSIGGSNVGAVMGLNAYKTAAEVWDGIFTTVAPVTAASRHRMDRGACLEPIIAAIYSEETQRRLQGDGRTRFIHPACYWLHGTPDRTIVGLSRGLGALEIKCLGMRTYRECVDDGLDPSYYAQLQLYLDILDMTWGAFAVFNAEEWTLHHFDVERDNPFIDVMHARARDFWFNHVLGRVRPIGGDPVMEPVAILPPLHLGTDHTFLGTEEWVQRATRLRVAWETKKLAELAYDQEKEDFKLRMSQYGMSKIRIPSVGKINWIRTTTRRMDKERFALEHPDIHLESYTIATETSTFTIYPEAPRR